MSEMVDLVQRSLDPDTAGTFTDRVDEQAARLKEEIVAGHFDNEQFAVGLEVEVYAVENGGERPTSRVTTLPEQVFDGVPNEELGLHNAELNTDPDVLDGDGFEDQADRFAEMVRAARAETREHDCTLALDAMWTIPPEGGTESYLRATEERDGVVLACNMRSAPRYAAIDNDMIRSAGGAIPFDVPGCSREFPSILFESMATSIQPHLQIPTAEAFPEYFNAAIRTLGPVLALSTNSPFLPADLYADVDDPEALVDRTHHELRIAAFEQSVNHTGAPKVRVPRDIEDATDVADRVVADDLCAPFLREWIADGDRQSVADQFWEFDHKRTTYWRWVRCVIGGQPVGTGDERSLRIEYRPIPTQPTVRDIVGMQALVAGLLRGLVSADHPLTDLPREAAEEAFYSAVEDGLDADLAWVTADGDRTTDHEAIFEEVFDYARRGLAEAGVSPAAIDRYIDPIQQRWAAGETPSTWKKARVREGLADGLSLQDAITRMQHTYLERSRENDSFAAWL